MDTVTAYPESIMQLEKFIKGFRGIDVRCFDWDIPIRWGVLSDPFQPKEKQEKVSLEMLRVFASSGYPFIVTTKSTLSTTYPYYDVLKSCNFVYQVSLTSERLTREYESNLNNFKERLNSLEKMAKIAKRVVVRVSPFMPIDVPDIIKLLPTYKNSGVELVCYEEMRFFHKAPNTVRDGQFYRYDERFIAPYFKVLKDETHANNLIFGSANGDYLSDDPACCVGRVQGFMPHKACTRYHRGCREEFCFTAGQTAPRSGRCLKGNFTRRKSEGGLDLLSYKDLFYKLTGLQNVHS
jgi:hypothetical protein